MATMKVGTVASLLGGDVLGDADRELTDVASLQDAGGAAISFAASDK